MPEPKEPPPPKPPRPPKVEKPPKPPREVYQPQGTLGQLIAAAAEAAGVHVNDLRVMSAKRDPYTLDTEQSPHRPMVRANRSIASSWRSRIHLRGLHYIISSLDRHRATGYGKLYVNDRRMLEMATG